MDSAVVCAGPLPLRAITARTSGNEHSPSPTSTAHTRGSAMGATSSPAKPASIAVDTPANAQRSPAGPLARASTAKDTGMPTAWATASTTPAAPSDMPWPDSSEGSQPVMA